MKKIISVLIVTLMLFAFGAVPAFAAGDTPAAASSGALDTSALDMNYYTQLKGQNVTLNVSNWGEYMSVGVGSDQLDVVQAFQNLTGIKVNYTTYSTNEELYTNLQSSLSTYDLIIPSDYMISRLIGGGKLAKLDFSMIPNYSNIMPHYENMQYDPTNEYSVPYFVGNVVLIYNTKMVSDPVDSWDILWNDKYKGKILMFDNARDTFAIALEKLGYDVNTTDPAQLQDALDLLKQQAPLVKAYVMDTIFDKMENGDAAIAPYYSGDAITMMDANPDLAAVYPKEGTNVFVDACCIPSNSQNKQAAEMFINFLLEPQVALANINYVGYATPNQAAYDLLPDDVKNNPIVYPGASVQAAATVYTDLGEQADQLYDQMWIELKSANSNNNWIIPAVIFVLVIVCVVVIVIRRSRKKRRNY